MTPKVRRGLIELAEYGRCFLEADEWSIPQAEDAEDNGTRVSDMETALAWAGYAEFEKGGSE